MYFLDRFNADNLFSLNFDTLDLGPSFKTMDMALAAPRFTEFAPIQGIVAEASQDNQDSSEALAPSDSDGGVNAPTPPGPLFAVINGTAGDDILNGTASPDTINGLGGNDTINGGGGADTINGGDGDDYMILEFNQGSDDFFGGNGSDTIDLSDPNFTSGLTFDLAAGTYQFGDANSVENVRGTQNGDSITGSNSVNDLWGNGGNDTIDGLGGNDTLRDGSGDDVVNGGDGADTFIMGQGADTLNGDAGNDLFDFVNGAFDIATITDIDGGSGTDSFQFLNFNSNYQVDLAAGEMIRLVNDQLIITLTSVENVTAGNGDDILIGNSSGNVLIGGNGDDIIDGAFGLDTMDGGAGNDTMDASFFNSTYEWDMSTGVTNFAGESAVNFENAIMGGGDDDITGTAGDNIIDGGDGADILDGAGGDDTVSYTRSDAAVTVDLGANTASGGHADGDTISNFENVIGSDFNDDLVGSGGTNTLDGGAGNDTIQSGSGNDTMNGGDGDDLLQGNNGINVYNGDAGDDTLQILGFTAGNTFDGGADTDTFSFETFGSDYIANLTTGVYDRVTLGNASTLANIENITAGFGDDILTGNGSDNILIGGFGNDTINAMTGTNTVDAGLGNDTVIFQSGANLLGSYDGGSGTDLLDANGVWSNFVTFNLTTGFVEFFGNNASLSNFENVIVDGDANIVGNSGNNVLTGGSGENTIAGMDGADTMDGGADVDTLDYSASDAAVTINLATNSASGGHAAGDVISNFESIEGSAFNDTLTSSFDFGVINGNDGNDTINLTGGLNGSTLNGGNGDDVITSAVAMNGSTLNGGAGNDTLTVFNDSLLLAADTANGGAGDDLVIIGIDDVLGLDLDGGADVDTLSLAGLSNGYTVSLAAGTVVNNNTTDAVSQAINFENAIGTAQNDTITGTVGSNEIAGGFGDDIINGGSGDDILDGGVFGGSASGTGDDIINGGAGDDIIIYSREGSGGTDIDTNDGGTGIDTFVMSTILTQRLVDLTAGIWTTGDINGPGSTRGTLTNIENVRIEGIGNVDVRGDAMNNVITFTDPNADNEAEGMAGDDIIDTGGGDDRVEGGAGADDMDGGAGTDILDYATSAAGVTVNLGTGISSNGDAAGDTFVNFENLFGSQFNDILTGDALNNFISAADGNDRLDGGAGDDVLQGDFGADTLLGGAGADVNNGGDGFDSMDYRAATSRVVVNLDTGGTLGDAAGDTYFSIERVYGSDFNDTITGTAANEFFYGEDGNDTINAGDGIDRVYGGNGNDIQRGDGGNDQLYGSAGNDQLNGGTGFDIANYRDATSAVSLNLGSGGTLGDAAGDTYFGIEAVYGSDFNDILAGNSSANELRGWDGDDILNGAGGSDRLFGGAGADALNGGTGTDIAVYTDAASGVTVNLATVGTVGDAAGDTYSSIEWVWGSDFNDIITGDAGANRLEGRDGNDTLNGGDGNDRLIGGEGDDTINGGDGVDTIFGQNGNDNLIGAGGNDFFFGSDGGDTINGGLDFDTVSYLASTSAVGVDLQAGGFIGDANGDTYASIERVFGSQHNDYIVGSNGANSLLGNGGSDYLEGGLGNDSLFGGAATDSFGYNTTNGDADVISDFSTAGELIYILGGDAAFDTFAEVQAVGTDAGANVIFDFGGGNTLTIVGQNLADLNAGDFDFSGPPPAAEPLDDDGAFASEPLSFDEIVAIHQAFAADANEVQLDDMLI